MAITYLPNLYQSDKASQKYFESWGSREMPGRAGGLRTSPLHRSLERQNNQSMAGYTAHSFGEINPYKVCEIAITGFNSGAPLSLASGEWGNWRNSLVSRVDVYDKVLLWTSEKSWDFSFENKYENAYSKLNQDGLLSKVSQISEALRSVAMMTGTALTTTADGGGRMISKYKEAPAWSGTSPLGLTSSLTFNFRFGQAGVFSGEHEVVRPILALSVPFAPVFEGSYAKGPLPTAPTYFWRFMIKEAPGLIAGLGSAIKQAGNLSSEANKETGQNYSDGGVSGALKGALNTTVTVLSDLEKNVINKMNTTIENVLNGVDGIPASRFLHVRVGRIRLPPLKVANVAWKFDMTHTDEYGFPTAGSITYGGLEGIEFASQNMIAELFPSIIPRIEQSDYKDFGGKSDTVSEDTELG